MLISLTERKSGFILPLKIACIQIWIEGMLEMVHARIGNVYTIVPTYKKVGNLKGGNMAIEAEVDSKGRVTIPADLREQLGIEPRVVVELEILKVKERKSFVKEARGRLKGRGDAVELLHKESPFR